MPVSHPAPLPPAAAPLALDAPPWAASAAVFAGLNPESESLADGIGQSYGIIGYKGKVWTLRYRGEIAARHTYEGKASHGQAQVIGLGAEAWHLFMFVPVAAAWKFRRSSS